MAGHDDPTGREATTPDHWAGGVGGVRGAPAAGTHEAGAAPTTIDDTRFAQLSRRAVLTGGVATLVGGAAFLGIGRMPRLGGAPALLRASYEFNEDLWRTLYDLDRLAPEFPFERSAMPIVNGRRGLEGDVDVDAWRLQVTAAGEPLAELSLDDVRAMPFTETIFEFKCIEGWSQVTAFGGVRFSDFLAAVAPGQAGRPYVAMNTPSGEYPVAMDMQALMHPQTLLSWEMQREPLTVGHGAPLRLSTPLKYGIKNIRRIGSMDFTDAEPEDFWGSRTYSDWVGL